MIISRTPFRVSLFGGGSDYPAWYAENRGAVLGFAIDKYCYISLRQLPPFFEHKHRIVYSIVENVKEAAEIQHPSVRAVLMDRGVETGVEIHHDGDLPARSGLGSSSSFTVGMINAVEAFFGRIIGRKQLAKEAIRTEHHVIEEHVGIQDQIWAAYGGLNRVKIFSDGDFDVQSVVMPQQRRDDLLSHLMLFYTGISRFAPVLAKKQIDNMANRVSHLERMTAMVDEGLDMLQSGGDLKDIGMLLHESWMLKKELAGGVSTPEVDAMYDAAKAAGALGGKLLGAGGGGFILVFASPEHQQAIRAALSSLVEVRFGIDNVGSKIVVYEPTGFSHH